MTSYATDILGSLALAAKEINPDVFQAYPQGQAATIWTEGGEWPAYRDEFHDFKLGTTVRSMSVTYESPGTIKALDGFLDSKFRDSTVVGLTMECGSGKSTTAMLTLHNMKMGKRTIVVQPSIVVAQGLVKYVSNISSMCQLASKADQLPVSRTLVYTGVGGFLDMLLCNKICDDDIVVIDESHCVSFTHTIVTEILSTMVVPVLLMTASTSPVVRGLRGVKLIEVNSMHNDVSEHLSREGNHSLVIGVTDNATYASPANAFIGATIDLRVLYDTGLRPEPRVQAGVIIEGERRATILEIIQMVGRLGRCGRGGTAYYNTKARVMGTEGLALYDVMYRAIRSAIGLDKALGVEKAIKVWKMSGIVGKRASLVLPVGSVAPDLSRLNMDSPNIGEYNSISQRRRADTGTDSSTLFPGSSNFAANGFTGISAGAGPNHSRHSSSSSFLSVQSRPKPRSSASEDGSDENLRPGIRRGSSSRGKDFSSKYQYHRTHTNTGEPVMLMKTVIRDKRTGMETTDMVPDPGWRPFRRADELREGEVSSDTGISDFVARVDRAVSRGDMIYPLKFLLADRSSTTISSLEEARLVLAGRMLPTFDEIEMLSVVIRWNDVADATVAAMPKLVVEQFLNYFTAYTKWSNMHQF